MKLFKPTNFFDKNEQNNVKWVCYNKKLMISFSIHSAVFRLETREFIPISLDKAWEFFSSPANLKNITPPNMGFNITSPVEAKMYPGQIITYKVSPFPLLKTNWVTEITQVKEYDYFVDEQRFGPYTLWHHRHSFKQVDNGIEMLDVVHYKIPAWFLSKIVNQLFVKRKLLQIFTYRSKKLQEIFF